VQHGRIEIEKRLKKGCAILQRRRRILDQPDLEFDMCV